FFSLCVFSFSVWSVSEAVNPSKRRPRSMLPNRACYNGGEKFEKIHPMKSRSSCIPFCFKLTFHGFL
ncbi:hypothetical protein L9F63_008502, partial [Diploptera punctata]